jgi:DNA-directed RNA polymerase beta subunit
VEAIGLGDILAPGVAPAPQQPAPSVVPDVPAVPEPVTRRNLDDFRTIRTSLYDNVMKAVQGRYPYENERYRLGIENLKWSSPERFSLAEQKKAIMRGETMDRRLEGDWVLYDKEAGMEAARRRATIAHVPHMTGRGTFISKGNEYTVANQMRLKPGVYTRVKDNGIIEAHVNTRPGTGPSFRVYMEPDTGFFRLAVGQSTLKLYPILKSMGVSEDDLEKYWGRELLARNREATDPRAVQRAFNKLVKVAPTLEDEALEEEADAEAGTKEAAHQ